MKTEYEGNNIFFFLNEDNLALRLCVHTDSLWFAVSFDSFQVYQQGYATAFLHFFIYIFIYIIFFHLPQVHVWYCGCGTLLPLEQLLMTNPCENVRLLRLQEFFFTLSFWAIDVLCYHCHQLHWWINAMKDGPSSTICTYPWLHKERGGRGNALQFITWLSNVKI